MTKKVGKRFGYLGELDTTGEPVEAQVESATTKDSELHTVPRGAGRMSQDRTQLNVRIPTLLKRRAGAKATLEGRTLGEIVEELLQVYVSSLDDAK